MAYNLQSLITILQQILNPEQSRWIVDHNKPQLQSLLEKADSLQDILEKSSFTKIASLESQIRDAAYNAEDIIESHMVHQMLSNPESVSLTFSTPDLQQVTQELDSAMEQVVKLMEGKRISSSSSGASFSHDLTSDVHQATQQLESLKLVEAEGKKMPTGAHAPFTSSKSVVVGVEADLKRLKDRLTNMESKLLKIIPIVGMGGIGKTTLAQKLYEDPLIVSHFNFRAWTTVSQNYNMRSILLSLLRCIIGKETDEYINKNNNELKDILRKSLYGRRYMIVLDDTWSKEVWDEIRMYLPNNNNGSRIVITTRELDVAKYADSESLQHEVKLLSESESWNLLCQIVFGEEDCPDHVLQEIGTKIARDCGGLPLAINVIGGLLSKIERSKDAWEKIGKDVIAAIAESDERCSNILSLSYNNLPNHLKPCFLYMGAFPEDYEIKSIKLVRMWVAEGFVRPNGDKNLEEEAEDCLTALVERNLIKVRQYKYGKPKSYNMHDLLRDLCIRKSDEEKFLHVKNCAFSNPRRVGVDTSHGTEDVNASTKSMSLARSFIAIRRHRHDEIPSGAFSGLRLVRVLDIMDMTLQNFPVEIFEFVNLRFLAFSCHSLIPRGISRLWNLQILIAKAYGFDDASEIWQLRELRYLRAKLDSYNIEDMINSTVKEKLLKLQMIQLVLLAGSVIRRGLFKSIPNIRKLGIVITDMETSTAIDLSHLHKLDILRYWSRYFPRLSNVRFPCNIRKLFVNGCVINPGVMTTLCALHKLEVLKISGCRFEREEETRDWELGERDEFRSLQFLHLDCLTVKSWRADETNFPKLRYLVIKECYLLEEIPSGIGEIPTLQLIELNGCKPPLVASAEQIVEVQQSDYANYDLKLHIIDI